MIGATKSQRFNFKLPMCFAKDILYFFINSFCIN